MPPTDPSSVLFQQFSTRVNKYLRMMHKPEVEASLLEAYWDAVWAVTEQTAAAWYASSLGNDFRGSGAADASFASSSLPPRSPSPAGGVPPSAITRQNTAVAPRLKIVVIPKFLTISISREAVAAVAGDATQSSPWSMVVPKQRCKTPQSHHTTGGASAQQQQLRPPTNGGGGRSNGTAGRPSTPHVVVDVAKDFQSAFNVAQSTTSTFRLDGIPQRVTELSNRDTFGMLLQDGRCRQQQHAFIGSAAAVPMTADDMAVFGKMLAETVGTLGGKAIGSSGAASSSYRLRCGPFGELRIGGGTVDFNVASAMMVGGGGGGPPPLVQRGVAGHAHRLGSATSLRRLQNDDVPLSQRLGRREMQQQPQQQILMGSGGGGEGGRPMSSGASSCSAAAAADNGNIGGDGDDCNGGLNEPSLPPELRRYHHQGPQRCNSRPQSRDSSLLASAFQQTGSEAAVDRPPFLALVGARPSSSCSSTGPSASARGGCGSNSGRIGTAAGANSPARLQQQYQRRNWKPEHRRHHLDDELAHIQRALESRLGIAVGPDTLKLSHDSAPRSLSAAEEGGGNGDHSGLGCEGAMDITQRSATALAYYAAAADENRRPPLAKREVVMCQAIERHRKEMKLRELEDARITAQRGCNDEMSVFARVQSELLRQEEANQLMEQLKLQQVGRRDARGKFIAEADTCIMRPVDVRPFATPAPGGVVVSVAGLGSDPEAVVQEKRLLRAKKKAYHAELDTQQSACLKDREAKIAEKRKQDAARLELHRQSVAAERDEIVVKKRNHRTHFTEAWDLQRNIASPNPM